MLPRLLAAALAAALVAGSAVANAQSVTSDAGTTHYLTGTVDERSTGGSMVGMTVTATFSNATTLTATWGLLGNTLLGPDYGVDFAGLLRISHLHTDTYPLTPWYLRQYGSTYVTRLVFEGTGGQTLFDRSLGILGLGVGTPGSSLGADYADLNALWNGSSAIYRNQVAVGGTAPAGDLFTTLQLDFTQALPRLTPISARQLYFNLDTDSYAGTLTTAAPVVTPEPGTWALLATGLAGVGMVARRRRAR